MNEGLSHETSVLEDLDKRTHPADERLLMVLTARGGVVVIWVDESTV